jgi:ABC-type multidrug transport system fused ATPase/permease subunit
LGARLRSVYGLCVSSERIFVPLALASLLHPFVTMAIPYLCGEIVNAMSRKDEGDAYRSMLLAFTAASAAIVLDWFRNIESYRLAGHDIGKEVSIKMLRKLSVLSLGQVSENIAERREVLGSGIMAAISSVGRIFKVLPAALLVVVLTAFLLEKSVSVGLVSAVCVALYGAASVWINAESFPRSEAYRKKESKIEERYFEKAANMPLIIRTDQAARAEKEYVSEHEAYAAEGREIWKGVFGRMALIRDPIALICLFAVTALSLREYFRGEIPAGGFVARFGIVSMLFSALSTVGATQFDFMSDWVKLSKLLELLETPRETPVPSQPIRLSSRGQSIRFEDVWFKGLRGATFEIPAGGFIALIGPSGSGKTTSLSLMQGGYRLPQGRILVGGREIESLNLAPWRSSIGYVEQHPLFWDDTLSYNILYGLNGKAKDVTKERLLSVMTKAQLARFHDRLDLNIGERGSRLSGGERQRVAIARALIGDPHMLVFDEAMTGLDTENEARLINTILELAKETGSDGRRKYTVVAATHNIAMAAKADRIIVFDKGTVVGVGDAEKLSRECDAYNRLVALEHMNLNRVRV